jgi:hypothetical protein
MDSLPNQARNEEVEDAIKGVRLLDLGAQSERGVGVANALASLNVAESLQFLQLQITETSKENRVALHQAMDNLIESNARLAASNERQVNAMKWLTVALVLVGIAQVVIGIIWHK